MRLKRDSRPLLVLDIDQTMIDSTHRENSSVKNDALDLPHYLTLKHCPLNGAMSDSILPLGQFINDNITHVIKRYNVVILTARQCDNVDYQSLYRLIPNILDYAHYFISRDNVKLFGGYPQIQNTGGYKAAPLHHLNKLFKGGLTVIDDCPQVLQVAKIQGHNAICARDLWHYDTQDFTELFFG